MKLNIKNKILGRFIKKFVFCYRKFFGW